MLCKICNLEIKGQAAGAHKRWCGQTGTCKDRVLVQKNCEICNDFFEVLASPKHLWHKKSARKGRSYCGPKCRKPFYDSKMTDEVKEKISKSRKKYLQENPDKHVWKRHNKFNSVPCKELQLILTKEGFVYETEWNPMESRAYAIDIAFPDIKIGIEVNGNQHYTKNNTLKKYYQQRHDEIEALGWTLIEMHYANVYKAEELEKLLKGLRENKAHLIEFTKVQRNVNKTKQDRKLLMELRKREKEIHQERQKNILRSIDMTEYGWVQKASIALGVSHTQVKRIVKKYYSEYDYYIKKRS